MRVRRFARGTLCERRPRLPANLHRVMPRGHHLLRLDGTLDGRRLPDDADLLRTDAGRGKGAGATMDPA